MSLVVRVGHDTQWLMEASKISASRMLLGTGVHPLWQRENITVVCR